MPKDGARGPALAHELPMMVRENALKRVMRDMIDEVQESAEEMAHLRGRITMLEDRIDALRGWDPLDEDGCRMQAEAVQKQEVVHALKARAETMMVDLLQKIVMIEEKMEVWCTRRVFVMQQQNRAYSGCMLIGWACRHVA